MEDNPLWKKTSKIKTRNISSTIGPILLKFEMFAYRTKLNVIETFKGRRPFMEDDSLWKKTSKL